MRLFVSIPLPVEQREHLERALAGRPLDPDQWHLTLAFLGDRDEAPDLAHVSAAPFELSIAGSGSFPGVEWAGVAGDLAALHELAGAVCVASRVQPGTYRPHITYSRRGRAVLAPTYVGPPWIVGSFDLVESVRTDRYEHHLLGTYPLCRT
ncbi:MAG: 2-5 ligase [Frankiales bacterium]|nr:2-5 ligase [Frankiales bacterium]